jgi:hypothetical protein
VASDPVRRSAARVATLVAVPVALVVGLVSLWSAGAFRAAPATTPVTMAAPALDPDATAICRAVVAKLPEAVREMARRPVTAGPEQNAAYGDPPLTLACGVAPAAVEPTAEVYPLSGVCWVAVAQPGDTGTVWTTVDRQVPVAVTVPGAREGSAQSVIPFAAAVGTANPRLTTPPTGCG